MHGAFTQINLVFYTFQFVCIKWPSSSARSQDGKKLCDPIYSRSDYQIKLHDHEPFIGKFHLPSCCCKLFTLTQGYIDWTSRPLTQVAFEFFCVTIILGHRYVVCTTDHDIIDMAIHSVVCQKTDFHGNSDF
jgi:hypothetical protein